MTVNELVTDKPTQPEERPQPPANSYAQILKSSSIMGGAAGVNLLLGMIRTKLAAVLIGTTGVGLLASFTALQGIIGAIAGLGIQSSAVREIAAAVGQGDEQAIGRAVLTLRRICWLTGLAGMGAMSLAASAMWAADKRLWSTQPLIVRGSYDAMAILS